MPESDGVRERAKRSLDRAATHATHGETERLDEAYHHLTEELDEQKLRLAGQIGKTTADARRLQSLLDEYAADQTD